VPFSQKMGLKMYRKTLLHNINLITTKMEERERDRITRVILVELNKRDIIKKEG
jgi:hypothetical protein